MKIKSWTSDDLLIEEIIATNMLKPKLLISFFCLFTCYLQSCDLFESVSKKEELPPITQEGKDTFGCLVNGELWLPKGNNGTPNLNLSYDPSFNKGTFDLRGYRYLNSQDSQYIILFSDSLASTGIYPLQMGTHQVISFRDASRCFYSGNDTSVFREGALNISRFDLQNQIISGTFEFTMYMPGCDTIKVTEGRFDIKF